MSRPKEVLVITPKQVNGIEGEERAFNQSLRGCLSLRSTTPISLISTIRSKSPERTFSGFLPSWSWKRTSISKRLATPIVFLVS